MSNINLYCNHCGSDNMNSYFAKHEGETCRQFGCFGTMTMMSDAKASKLRSEVPEIIRELRGGQKPDTEDES